MNVRILAPTGKLGYVPEEKLAEALAAGAILVTAEKMREIRQATFMEHGIFKVGKPKAPLARHKRKSLWKTEKR